MGRDAPPPAAASGRRHGVYLVHTSPEHAWSVPGDAPVLNGSGTIVGFTTTSAKGAVTGHTIALGYVKNGADGRPLARAGEAGLRVECYGHAWPVELLGQPPVAVGGRPEPAAEKLAVGA